jgi:hypothetical protein
MSAVDIFSTKRGLSRKVAAVEDFRHSAAEQRLIRVGLGVEALRWH